MKYRGFREDLFLAAARELEGLGLKASEVHAILNLAGAKWRAVQIREGRGYEYQDEADGRLFHDATLALMQATMTETQRLAELGHSPEGERFMLLAISITLNELFSRGPKSIRRWIRSGDQEKNRIVLSFAIGSTIIVEPQAIDILMHRIVKFRYGAIFDAGKDVSGAVLEVIERLGNAGYSCLKPIADSME
jgi:hypothetical protein